MFFICSRPSTVPLSRRLRMCAPAAFCRSSGNCPICGIAVPTPRSGGTKFASRCALVEDGDSEVLAVTENFSSNGVLLYADQLLHEGAEVGLILALLAT